MIISKPKKALFISFKIAFLLAIILGISFAFLCYRAKNPYRRVKQKEILMFKGSFLQYDPILGLSNIPDSRAAVIFPDGRLKEVIISEDGLRIPHQPRGLKRPLILALGGSFTFGHPCSAEESFPYLVSQHLNGTELNAGINTAGLVQMLSLARKLIPKYLPEFVIAQYSDWLVYRAVQKRFHYRKQNIKFATPYFVKSGSTRLEIHPPIFKSAMLAKNHYIYRFNTSESDAFDYFSFLYHIVMPGIYDSFSNELTMKIDTLFALSPEVETDRIKIVQCVYSEIVDLCRQYDSNMIILMLRFRYWPQGARYEELEILRNLNEATIAEADKELDGRAIGSSFKKKYLHWYNHRLLDNHPNSVAHEIIAESIVKVIE